MRPQELVERALELLGPDRGTVLVEHSTSANLRWANSTLTTNGMTTQQTVHVVAQPEVPEGFGSGTASAVIRSGADLDALEAEVLNAMVTEATAGGSASAAKLVLLAIDRRRAALAKKTAEPPATDAAGRPSLRIRREAL